MKNKYVKVSHISESKFREIVKLFSEDLSAIQIAHITNLNRNTINRYLMLFRERIVEICEKDSPFSGEVEVDESYFGAVEFEVREEEVPEVKLLSLVF